MRVEVNSILVHYKTDISPNIHESFQWGQDLN